MNQLYRPVGVYDRYYLMFAINERTRQLLRSFCDFVTPKSMVRLTQLYVSDSGVCHFDDTMTIRAFPDVLLPVFPLSNYLQRMYR